MCILGSVFSFRPNKLRHISKVAPWWIIQHIFVSTCSVGRKTWFMRKPWVPNSRSVISPKIWPRIHPFFPKYAPVSTPSSYCIGYRAILTTRPSYYPKCILCNMVVTGFRLSNSTLLSVFNTKSTSVVVQTWIILLFLFYTVTLHVLI